MWFIIFIFGAIGVFLIAITTSFERTYETFKQGILKGTQTFDSIVHSRRKNFITKAIADIDTMIYKSNIRLYIPYSALFHMLISILCMFTFFIFISVQLSFIISLLFSILGFMIPFVVLQIVGDFMNLRLKKYSVDFLIILKNYLKSCGDDIFKAYEESIDSLIEPMRTYVKTLVYEYKHKISPVQALDNFAKKFAIRELKTFVENQKICYINGGNMESLIDEYIDDISGLNDDSEKEDTEDTIMNVANYMIVILNFILIYFILNSEFKTHIVDSLWGQVVLSIDIVIAIYTIYRTLRREV